MPLDNAGARLLRAREAAGMSRAQACAILRIPERHLVAIETGDYGALPARTYAVGFSRSYAKVVGLDPVEIVNAVRSELDAQEPAEPRRAVQTFEPGDPARVPGGGLVWLAAMGIVVVLVAVFFFARPMIAPAMELPSIIETSEPATVAADAVPAPAPAPAADGTVVFTAMEPKVWVRFTDAEGNQLLQKEMIQGESWTIPADQVDVRLARHGLMHWPLQSMASRWPGCRTSSSRSTMSRLRRRPCWRAARSLPNPRFGPVHRPTGRSARSFPRRHRPRWKAQRPLRWNCQRGRRRPRLRIAFSDFSTRPLRQG